MVREFSRRLLGQLEKELEEISFGSSAPLERLEAGLKLVSVALEKLRVFVSDHPFASDTEEIYFFKVVKPAFVCWQVYFTEVFTIESGIPFGDADLQRQYFENELTYVKRFFSQHRFLFAYYRMGEVELDSLYFLRCGGNDLAAFEKACGNLLVPPVLELEVDPSFSTPCDFLFSKLMAFEKLRDFLRERIVYLKKDPVVADPAALGSGGAAAFGELRWTGDSINLAELAFGMYQSGQLNNGSASMRMIFRWLEEQLGVSIGLPAKRWAEIRRRKRLSRTKFLEEMIELLVRKMDKEDAYVP